jgi:hypothetical protein
LNRRSLLAFVAGLLALATNPSSHAWGFEDHNISSPLVRDNLAVYFIHGNGTGAAAPLTLDQAVASGAAKIYESPNSPIAVENFSDQSVFVQLGTLLKGGLQDQVVAQSMILPPRSGRLPLDLLCVDPFRSAARGEEDPTAFSTAGTLFPWRMARLAMLAGSADSKAVRLLRQSGLWWSIDTARSQLSRSVGEPLEPPEGVTWKTTGTSRAEVLLRARQSSWNTSLPLALENRRLALMQAPYLDAFPAEPPGDDVIGAVLTINGRIEGAEIYQSHELFRHMWPNLLRAYAIHAIAGRESAAQALPSIETVNAFLAAAQEGQARGRRAGRGLVVRESEAAIYSETRTRDGNWISRSYVPKLEETSPVTPDALVVSILQSGQVDGRPLASLGDKQVVVLQSAAPDQWSAAIAPSLELARELDPALWPEWERIEAERSSSLYLAQAQLREWERARDGERRGALSIFPLMASAAAILFVLLRRWVAGRRRNRAVRALAVAAMNARRLQPAAARTYHLRRLLAALIAAASVAAAGVIAVIARLSLRAAAGFAHLRRALRDRREALSRVHCRLKCRLGENCSTRSSVSRARACSRASRMDFSKAGSWNGLRKIRSCDAAVCTTSL